MSADIFFRDGGGGLEILKNRPDINCVSKLRRKMSKCPGGGGVADRKKSDCIFFTRKLSIEEAPLKLDTSTLRAAIKRF